MSKLTAFFDFGIWWQTPKTLVFILEGRAFTLYELKKLVIAASGGFTNGLFLQWRETPVWELLEAIEAVASLQES